MTATEKIIHEVERETDQRMCRVVNGHFVNGKGWPCCPACSNTNLETVVEEGVLVRRCRMCDALFSDCIGIGDSYKLVLPLPAPDADQIIPERTRYFDFLCHLTTGMEVKRRHGWYDRITKRIVQVG